jgi:4-azaleucine resistance transporter AzlC
MKGIKHGLPVCFGYFSVSMAFGITAVLEGMPIWSVILISLLNLTSAGQFAGTNIIVAHGTMMELAITSLIINMRYFLMSLSVSQKMKKSVTLLQRMAIAFGITDEIFAISVQRDKKLSASYMAGLILTPLIGWVGGTTVGAVATSFMPAIVSEAMGISLYAMFIAIVMPPARNDKKVLLAVILSVVLSLVFNYVPIFKGLGSGWIIIIITLIVSSLFATIFPIDIKEEEYE